jgi:hypothetical protein
MEYSMNGTATLKINVACNVEILPFVEDGATVRLGSNKVRVEVEGEGVKVSQTGDTVTIRQENLDSQSGGVTIIGGDYAGGNIFVGSVNVGGRSISTSGGTTIITGGSGRVVVNGKVIDLDAAGDAPTPPSVKVYVNHAPVVEIDIQGHAKLTVAPMVSELFGSAKNQATISATNISGPLDVTLQNAANITKANVQGTVKISASNSSRASITGTFESVDATASNSSSINTSGTCTGTYTATASNSSSINHYGTVQGRVRRSATNGASVNV